MMAYNLADKGADSKGKLEYSSKQASRLSSDIISGFLQNTYTKKFLDTHICS
jgi:hypothetical protein